MEKRVVFLGSDHAGFDVKNKIKKLLKRKYDVFDLSPKKIKGDDYPDIAFKLGEFVRSHGRSKGILICGSGVGMAVAANKVHGIRAVAANDEYTAKMSRLDGDSNVLGLSGRHGSFAKKKKILDVWLKTEFSDEERHKRRIEKIKRYEGRR